MSNDIDVYSGGEIAPYDPGMPILAPLSPSPDTWGRTDVDVTPQQHHQSGPTLFGAALPAGTTPQHVQIVLAEIGGVYLSDFTKLGYPPALIHSSIQFLTEHATKPARQVTPHHNFKLPGELTGDWLAILFANHLQGLGGTQAQKQQFLNASLAWIDKLNARLNSQQSQPVQGRAAHGSAPNSAEAILNSLSDSDYAKVIKINEQALARTMQVLQQRWGDYTFQQNIEIAQNYLNNLPLADQRYFDQFTTGYVHMRNTPEFIIAMFDAATGAHSIPKDGAGIALEIAECERCMRTNRKQWLADPALQARYRTLLQLKG